MFSPAWWYSFFRPVVRDRREYRLFIIKVTLGSAVAALAVDVTFQLFLGTPRVEAVTSWVETVVIAGGIAIIASILIGRAHLELYEAKEVVDALSRTDPLTGLPNRRAFFEVADTAPAEAMALVIADVDRFKRVNDTRGHMAGDDVLRTVAGILAAELAEVGYVGRVGGEEFAVLGQGRRIDKILTALNAVRKQIALTPILTAGQAVTVTVSAGIAVRLAGTTFDELYAEADAALYRAKAGGRNRIHLAPSAEAMLTRASRRDLKAWHDDLAEDGGYLQAAGDG